MAVGAPAGGVSVNTHSVLAPVPVDVAVMTPAATVSEAIYLVAIVEQPAAVTLAGYAPLADAYSATPVLQAAIAAIVSDIFERTT